MWRKMPKETIWLVMALAGCLLMFERRTELMVQNNEVVVLKTTSWIQKREIKKTNASNVRDARIGPSRGRPCSLPTLEIYTKDGACFFELQYDGIFAEDHASKDVDSFRAAIETGSEFISSSQKDSFFWVVLVVISLVIFWYKRSWRLERERQARNMPPSAGTTDVAAGRTFRIVRRSVGKDGVGVKPKVVVVHLDPAGKNHEEGTGPGAIKK